MITRCIANRTPPPILPPNLLTHPAVEHRQGETKMSEGLNTLGETKIETIARVCKERDDFKALLRNLVEAKALAGVRGIVAGWNGESLPEPHKTRHDPRLGARIETNCGAMYALDEALTAARTALAA